MSVSLLPNEEDTVPSGTLLAYFKSDWASEVSKVIMFLQAQRKINGLVEKGGLLWEIQKCLETIHIKLVGNQTLVIPVFLQALFLVMGISIYLICCFSSIFGGFFSLFLLRGTIEKTCSLLWPKLCENKCDLKAQAIPHSPLLCTCSCWFITLLLDMDLLVDTLPLCLWPEATLVSLWTLLGTERLDSVRVCWTENTYFSVIVQFLTLNDQPPPSWRPHKKSINYPFSWDMSIWSVLVIPIRRWVRALGCSYIARTLTCPSQGEKKNYLQGTESICSSVEYPFNKTIVPVL